MDGWKQRLKTHLFIRCYDLPSSYARKHSVYYSVYTAAQLVLFFCSLSVLAVFGLNATVISLV